MNTHFRLNNESKTRINQLLGILILLILSISVIAYSNIGSEYFSKHTTNSVPRLMKTSSSSIPNYLNQFLSEEDKQLLEEYGQYNTELTGEDLDALQLYNEYLQQMTDPDLYSLQAKDYLMNNWLPEEREFTVPTSDELPNFEETFESVFFNDWINDDPDFTLPSGGVQQEAEQKIFDDVLLDSVSTKFNNVEVNDTSLKVGNDLSIYERVISTGEQQLTQRTSILGQPRIKLINPLFSGFDDVRILIRDAKTSVDDTGVISKVINVTMGLEYFLPKINHTLEIKVKIIRFNAWAKFIASFHIFFPVQLTIKYPSEVVEGESYSFNVTLTPLDIPDVNEFELKFVIDVGISLDIRCPKIRMVRKTGWIPGWKCRRWRCRWKKHRWKFHYWVPRVSWFWKNVWSYPIIYYNFTRVANYQTPLAGEHIDIQLDLDLDILPILAELNIPYVSAICKVLKTFLEIGIGFGLFEIYGKAVTGKLAITAGSQSMSESVGWTQNGGIEQINFVVPETTEEYLGLSVDELIFHSSSIQWVPEFFINFKDLSVLGFKIPLSEWLGEYRWSLPGINFGEFNLPSLDTYAIQTSSIIPAETYDFTMAVEEITPEQGQGALVTQTPRDQLYEITLQNNGFNDIIELGVQGLPSGYTATFDRAIPQYPISGTPTTVRLLISPPETITEGPGSWPFNVTATSQGKTNLHLADATIVENASLDIPEQTAILLSLGLPSIEPLLVYPDSTASLIFVGKNLGNQDDNITVEAKITDPQSDIIYSFNQAFYAGPVFSSPDFNGTIQIVYNDFDWSTDLLPSTYIMEVSAYSGRYSSDSEITRLLRLATTSQISVEFIPDYDMETHVEPENKTMYANFASKFTYTLNNTGNTYDNFSLTTEGWDDYVTFLDDTTILSLAPNEICEVELLLNITDPENVPSKNYTFRIKAISEESKGEVFDVVDIQVEVLPADYVPPEVAYESTYDSISGLSLPQSNLFTTGPVWLLNDKSPGIYTAYIDGVVFNSSTWSNDELLEIPVTGINPLSQGVHNITIVVSDDAGNIHKEQIMVTVLPPDTVSPSITGCLNKTLPQNFTSALPITWEFSEKFVQNMTLLMNGVALNITQDPNFKIQLDPEDDDKYLVTYLIQPGSLTTGDWNFTFTVRDLGNNLFQDSVFISIIPDDSEAPSFNVSPNNMASVGHSENLTFTPFDNNPDRYELYINDVLEVNTSWVSSIEVILPVDDINLSIGVNNLKLYLYDLASNLLSYSWTFTLRDIDTPKILSAPSSMTIYEHNLSYYDIFWEVTDLQDERPGEYEIYQDSVLVLTNTWTIGFNKIRLPVNNLTPGDYHFSVQVKDFSGNTIVSSLDISVKDILKPFIWPHDTIYFEPIYTASWFEFFISESHPASYILYLNGSQKESGTLSNDFPFVFVSLEELETGHYIYTLQVTDQSGNVGQRDVDIYVTDYIAPYIKRPVDLVLAEGIISSITWQILEANPQSYSLYLDDILLTTNTLNVANLTISIDSIKLGLGLHKYTLLVTDANGKTHSTACYVVIVDIAAPTLSHIADCRLKMSDPDLSLTWKAYDLHPASYRIYLDTNLINENTWLGDDIVVHLDSIENNGSYTITINVYDSSGNSADDELVVELILEESQFTSTSPKIKTPGFSFLLVFFIMVVLPMIRVKKRKFRE
ncbi:MAG: COG1470 family protein [Candidatus Hodarchaeales archaeon]